MIHFTCDGCGQAINEAHETRYVVRLEVYAAVDDGSQAGVDDADHLEEIEDLLERLDDLDEEPDDQLYKQARYDLCGGCRERFLNNPLGRAVARMGYSDN